MSPLTASVLAVDDNATVRKAISTRLGALGFRVVTAADGPLALQAVEQEAFDLVLLDLKMPGMRGDEVLRNLRARYSTTQLPVIILAASDDKQDIAQSLALGANDYVVKPGDMPVLLARIRTQLTLKDAAQRLAAHDGAGDGGLDRHFQTLYEHTPVSCFALDRELDVRYANHFATQLLGYPAQELLHRPAVAFYAPADRLLAVEYLRDALTLPARLHRWELRRLRRNGESVWMRETARVVGHGAETLLLMTCEDIDEAYRLNEKLSFHASHDELTGVANRKMLEERLARVLESARSEGSCHALIVLDVDQFKLVNDSCGHAAGDELLRRLPARLRAVIRKRDTLARIGSDEFALLLEDCALSDALATADAARRAVEAMPCDWLGARQRITASLGVVALDRHCDGVMNALNMADTACNAAKDSGRNRLHVYHADDTRVALRHGEMRWAARIDEALRHDRFELSLQEIEPLVGVGGGDHYELLIRMRDEHDELVLPGEFLPAAERYKLAADVDRWVIEHALQWLADNPHLLARLHLCSINLSGQSLGDDEVLDFILLQIDRHAVAPSKLCFEVTETAAISDLVQATRFIATLRERGCLFALDDFGSGFSSFAYLKSLAVDFVKIDGSFVRDIANDSIGLAMVRSINEIGHVMGKQTIAEFVEDAQVLALLRDVGVDYAQGYEIGRPTPLSTWARRRPDA